MHAFTHRNWSLVSPIIAPNMKVSGKQPSFGIRRLCPCAHKDYNLPHTLKPPPLITQTQRCSWQSDPCVHCSNMKMPRALLNTWIMSRGSPFKALPAAPKPRGWSNPPLYRGHNLEFDAFMVSDGEIGGRCSWTLNGSLRCDGKNDDCVPCWCLWGMIQALIGGWGAEKEESVLEVCRWYIWGCYLFHYWTKLCQTELCCLASKSQYSRLFRVGTNSSAELDLEQASLVITYSLYVEPSFLQSETTRAIVRLSSNTNCCLSWLQFLVLVVLFCKLAFAVIKPHLALLSNIYQLLLSIQIRAARNNRLVVNY